MFRTLTAASLVFLTAACDAPVDDVPTFESALPPPQLLDLQASAVVPNQPLTLTVAGVPQGATVYFLVGFQGEGAGICHPTASVCLDIRGAPLVLGVTGPNAGGVASTTVTVPPNASGVVWLQAAGVLGNLGATTDVERRVVGDGDLDGAGPGDDCDDTNPDIGPNAEEVCDGIDNDCSGDPDDVENPPLLSNQLGVCAGQAQTCGGVAGWQDDPTQLVAYDAADPIDPFGVDANCDGSDGVANDGVFVATTGVDGPGCGVGDAGSPCATVARGVAEAMAAGKAFLYVATGAYQGATSVLTPLTVVGGFDETWQRFPLGVGPSTVIAGSASGNVNGSVVFEAFGAPLTVVDARLVAVSAGGPTPGMPGQSSYGVHARNADVTLVRVDVQQAPGGEGADGADGTMPYSGRPPQGGQGFIGGSDLNACGEDSFARGGSGGFTLSVCTTANARGGWGGRSGAQDECCTATQCLFCSCDATTGFDGQNGSADPAVGGGDGGDGGPLCGAGDDGAPGNPGIDGDPGLGGAGGELSSGVWVSTPGETGGLGLMGGGGGGGGGGGACDTGQDDHGGGGGGGGGGGCRADTAGEGGLGGGGSFGVMVDGGSVVLSEVNFVRAVGGDGGNGGDGALGQPGGLGGSGGDGFELAGPGGDGGEGGKGGDSGCGGGGAGGPSVALYAPSSTLVASSVTISGGGESAGGDGGSYASGPTTCDGGAAGWVATTVCASGCDVPTP